MAKSDTLLKKAVKDFLESQDLRVSEIPRAVSQTPDLLVDEGSPDAVLIEIKQKTHDQGELDAYFQQMDESGLALRKKLTGYWNVLDGIVKDAVGQLTEHDPSRTLLHALWFHCEGYDADLHEQQIHATIYGTQQLISPGERPSDITCYYFRDSSFYRYASSLDAVIVSKSGEIPIHIALNNHSPHFHAIRQSKLAQAFGAAVFFPQQYEDGQKVMVCDHAHDRRSEAPTLDYLRAKYGITRLDTINGGMLHEAVDRVSPSLPS